MGLQTDLFIVQPCSAECFERIDVPLPQARTDRQILHDIEKRLTRIEIRIAVAYGKEVEILATLDDVTAAVAEQTDVVQSAVTLLDSLHQQLQDALASNDPAAIQAVVDSIEANKQALADAVAANTTTPPTP